MDTLLAAFIVGIAAGMALYRLIAAHIQAQRCRLCKRLDEKDRPPL